MATNNTARIRALNDQFRRGFKGGRVMLTQVVQSLGLKPLANLLSQVKGFKAFTDDNDPHGEHDFGTVTLENQTFFWKIDYYGLDLECGSEDPADPAQTTRVLTIMRADEY